MPDICPECGAPVPDGGSCRDHFHALLLLESEIPGGPGSLAHFYTIVTRDTRDQEFAQKRQLFLTEQGYRYTITAIDEAPAPAEAEAAPRAD